MVFLFFDNLLYLLIFVKLDDGSVYPDYDGFTVYDDGSAAMETIYHHARNMHAKSKCTSMSEKREKNLIKLLQKNLHKKDGGGGGREL
jgi:hypothetical protein